MRDVSRSEPAAIGGQDAAPTTTPASPEDFLVQELKSKLQAANVRERELHKHLLHHMQEKDALVLQVAELQRVCEALLLSQMQGGSGPAAEAATAAATRALSSPDVASSTTKDNHNNVAGDAVEDDATEDITNRASGAAVGPGAPQPQGTLAGGVAGPDTNTTSSSPRAALRPVASAPGPKPSPQGSAVAASPAGAASKSSPSGALKSLLGVAGGGAGVGGVESSRAGPPSTAEAAAATAAAAVHGRAAGTDPTVDIPQLLVERGGQIRITALWEAYQNRFGETPYSLKDLFSMVKSGAIPHVVHESPAGIRLLPSAPIYQHRLQQQLRRQQQHHLNQYHHQQLLLLQRQASAQAALGQPFLAQVGSAGPPPVAGASSGVGVGAGGVGDIRPHEQQQQEQQQQQQRSFSLPPPLANVQAPLTGRQTSRESATTCGNGGASDDNASFGLTSGEPSSASSPLGWAQPGVTTTAGDGKPVADSVDNNAAHTTDASGEASSSSSGRGGEDEADGSGLRFGSYGGEAPPAPAPVPSPASAGDASGGYPDGRPSSGVEQKREVDWKELNRNLNLLLKEEGEMNGRDLNRAFQTRFGTSPYLNGIPLRYAVSAGWLKGVCFDVSRSTYNLTVRVPAQRREDPPEEAPPCPPARHPRPRVPSREPIPAPAASNATRDDVDWKQLSSEFRQLLLPGALEPMEIHVNYHRTFKKPLVIGAKYSMRQAVMDGRLGGITFERGSRRLIHDNGGGGGGGGGGVDSGGSDNKRDGGSIDLQQIEERLQQQQEEQRPQQQPQDKSSPDSRSPPGDGVPAAALVDEHLENMGEKPAEPEKSDGEAVAERLSTGRPVLQPHPSHDDRAQIDKIDTEGERRGGVEPPCDAVRGDGESGNEADDGGGEDWCIRSATGVGAGGKCDRGEEKREIGWAPDTTNKFSPTPDTASALGAAAAIEVQAVDPSGMQLVPPPPLPPEQAEDTSARSKRHAYRRSLSLTRCPSLPLLSAGPYLSHKRGSSLGGDSLASSFRHELRQQEQERSLASTPRASSSRGERRGTPSSRSRNRNVAPMLGMLQNAQDLAATPAPGSASGDTNNVIRRHRSSAHLNLGATPGYAGSGSAADSGGKISTIRRITASRSTSFGFGGLAGCGGWGGGSRASTPVAGGTTAATKGKGRPALTPLSLNRPAHFGHEEEEGATPLGAVEGGWGRVGSRVARKRMRDKASRIMQKLPGPKLLMQVLENEVDPKNVRLTTQSEPKILMEVMPAALVVSLLVLTYLVFAGCLVLIVRYNLRGTSTLAVMAATGAGSLCAGGSPTTTSSSNAYVAGVDGPDPSSPSAAGCTIFSPDMSELSLDAPPFSSSLTASTTSSTAGEADADADADADSGARYGAVFSGHFSGMTKLHGSVSLHVSFADAAAIESLPDPATVDLALEACTGGPTAAVAEGVGVAVGAPADGNEEDEGGVEKLAWGTCENGWQPVLSQEGISARIRSLPSGRGYTMFNFFQNQETIRGQALVRQYRVQVGFVSDSASASTSATGGESGSASSASAAAAAESYEGMTEARWSLEYETGATEQWARIVLACVLVCWVPVWLAWCWLVFCYKAPEGFKNALHERKWLAFMGLSVALYLNPIMVVGNFLAPGSASWGLASEMSLSVAVAVFLVVTLCIADGVGKDRVGGGAGGSLGFYVPKVVFGVLTLAVMLLVDLTNFPSLTGWTRGSLLAVQNWPQAERHAFTWVASARVFMVVLWAVWMLCRIYISGCLLRKLPYVPNRYQQLSYRFFGLQAFLLGIVYVMFALWRLIDILRDDLGGNTVAAEFMLFIKTRQDHLGSVSILCAYTLQLLLLFLPSWFKESKLFRDIAVRFVYFEEQVQFANSRRNRRAQGGRGGQEDRGSRGATPGGTPRTFPGDADGREDEEDKPLFCVETAAWLLELAWETYNDPVGFENPNNYHFGVADFARVGFELVDHIHNAEHDTHCFILKDGPRGRLVVAFRGSVGTKHWMDNLSALDPRNLMSSPPILRSYWGGWERDSGAHRGGDLAEDGEEEDEVEEEVSRGTIELHMFSFGAPRVGNPIYAARYNDVVPHSFRVVVDGDPVPGVPSWWYTHVGTKVLIDGRGRGSLIIDPSFVEKRFFVRSKRYVLSHLIEAYSAGLRGNLLQVSRSADYG
eukprot:g13982.t1